jgi:LysM repeat protein
MLNRSVIIGLVGVGLLAIGAVFGWVALQHEDRVDTVQTPPAAAGKAPAQSAQTPKTGPELPTFDVVRINPAGDAVMAGRAAPNSTVHVFDGDREIGSVTADARGEWVFVPTDPLPSGSRELSLSAHVGDQDLKSDQVVVLAVPERGHDLAGHPTGEAAQPLVIATSRSGEGAGRVLQGPNRSGTLSLDLVGIDSAGALTLTGHAPPKATIQVYLDNKPLGRATAGADGRWQLQPAEKIPMGTFALRLDQVTPEGKVVMRVELPLARTEDVAADEGDEAHPSRVTVKPGDSLWRIARRIHGHGIAYLVIYQANRDQIRDPDLIYPGQVFHVSQLN